MKFINDEMPYFDGGSCVLMAVYAGDKPEPFERAIASVLANTLRPDQFVLVVDGPVPKAIEGIIQLHAENQHLEVVRLEANQGLAAALNAGLKHVRHRWVIRADADDFNLPERFARQAALLLQEPRLDVISCAIQEVDPSGVPIAVRRTALAHEDIVKQLLRRCPMNHMAVVFNAECVRSAGGYPSLHLKEDYALWCNLAARGAYFANLADTLVLATAGRDMYQRRGGWRYIRSEVELQALMVRRGLKGPMTAIGDGLLRSAVFAMPGFLRGLVYRRMLRSER